MIIFTCQEAWDLHLKGASENPKWMEDSKQISEELPISKRELFGLLVLARIANKLSKSEDWYVGYDPTASEPNDGFISDATNRIDIEHKLVPQMTPQDVLCAIISTYEKYAAKGDGYGNNRTLIIYANKASKGQARISDLGEKIKESSCPFDSVILVAAASIKQDINTVVIHATEHYPKKGMAQVDLNMTDGSSTVSFSDLESLQELVNKKVK
ncbi:MAG: hypothetical protein PF588_02000 [Candidatus Kapabacteria bacterium]|jgi:hypothetical protein|nr:hypothetical protein [Candidatus Kapabacteria bacterium]